MTKVNKTIFATLVFALASTTLAQYTATQAEERAKHYQTLLGVPIDGESIAVKQQYDGFHTWSWSTRAGEVTMDEDLKLKWLTDQTLNASIMSNVDFEATLPYLGNESFINKAKIVAAKVTDITELTDIWVITSPLLPSDGKPLQRGTAQVRLETKKAINARGYGNLATVSFDYQTGELVAIFVRRGYTYTDLENLILESQAIQAAKDKMFEEFNVHLESIRTFLHYYSVGNTKVCIPVYSIDLDFPAAQAVFTIDVDAKTGEVVGMIGGHRGSKPDKVESEVASAIDKKSEVSEENKKNNKSETENESAKSTKVWLGATLLATLVPASWLLLRLRKAGRA